MKLSALCCCIASALLINDMYPSLRTFVGPTDWRGTWKYIEMPRMYDWPAWCFLRSKHRNLTIERREELNLSVKLVRSHWKATHVTGEPSTRGETIVHILQSCTEAMRSTKRGMEREESGWERPWEKETERKTGGGREKACCLVDRELTFWLNSQGI